MINISREPNCPSSLRSQEIMDYIAECQAYKENPSEMAKPEKPVSYRNSDLLEAFDRCFFSKCYLTEEKFYNSWKMDVEHFIPQNEDPSLVYDWTNLYPAEHKANMCKPRSTPTGGYLDPCNNSDDVENDIFYTLTAYGEKPNFEARDQTNRKAINTASLLDRLHNGYDYDTSKNTADLRHAIHKKYVMILEKIIEWQRCTAGTQEEVQKRNELKLLLSRKSSFTMLCRSMPAVRGLPEDFFD